MGRESSPGLKWSLRAVSGISFVIGMGYVIWALVLQNPPKSALPMYVNGTFFFFSFFPINTFLIHLYICTHAVVFWLSA